MNKHLNEASSDAPSTLDGGESEKALTERKLLAARRRFVRMGAGGAAALMVTVVHKRAFASESGKKTTALQSLCGSIAPAADLKGANQKNALEQSAMGTPKGLQCNREITTAPTNRCSPSRESKYFKDVFGTKAQVVSSNTLKNGCGTLNNTVASSRDYRLYDKGYCPIVFDDNGRLAYDGSAKFYKKKDGNFIEVACKPGTF